MQQRRGSPGDLAQLPPSHIYEGTFLPGDAGAGTSRTYGLVFAIRRSFHSKATSHRFVVHHRGRAATLSLRLGGWVHFTGLHIDPVLPMSAKKRLLTDIAGHLARQDGVKFLMGDFNFAAGGETRYDGEGKPTTSDPAMANFFDEQFEGWAHQPAMTFRRMARDVGGATTASRIDRIYSNLTAFSLAAYSAKVGVKGDLFDR